MWRKGNPVHWWKCKIVQLLWKTVQSFLKKLEIELPYDTENSSLGIYLKEMKTFSQNGICISMFTVALFMIVKTWKQPNCPFVDEWMRKYDRAHTHTHTHTRTREYYLLAKQESLPSEFATTWMGLEGIMLSNENHTDEDKYLWSDLCVDSS